MKEELLKEKEKKLPKVTGFLPEEEKKERLKELNVLKKELENKLFYFNFEVFGFFLFFF